MGQAAAVPGAACHGCSGRGHRRRTRLKQPWHTLLEIPSRNGQADPGVVRTSLCVEARGGRLHVFLPPLRLLEDYLDLVAAVEDAAAELGLPVQVEGYTPPHDHRLNLFKLTPDPGVLEVNVHPAHSWGELVENTTTLYEEARLSRLCTENFLVDGRHTGTGGGNHVVLGGPTANRQPHPAPGGPAAHSSATGTTTRRFRTSSAACSSGPTTRRRVWTRRWNEPATSWNWRFKQIPDGRGDCPPPFAGGPRLPQPPHRQDRQHAPRRNSASTSSFPPMASADSSGWWRCAPWEMPPHAA